MRSSLVVFPEPALDCVGDELRPVVATDEPGSSVLLDELVEHFNDILRSVASARLQAMTLLAVFVQHAQDPKTRTPDGLIVDEIPTPNILPAARTEPLDFILPNSPRSALLLALHPSILVLQGSQLPSLVNVHFAITLSVCT